MSNVKSVDQVGGIMLLDSIKDSLQRDDRCKLTEINNYCAEKIEVGVKYKRNINAITYDVFSTNCITENVKTAVFNGKERENEMVIAGR